MSAPLLTLIRKEWLLELRRKTVIAGLGLYLFSLVFICYLAFALQQQVLSPSTWTALYWLTILFSAVNSVAKSFIGERRGMVLYLYTIASAHHILLARLIYNALLSCIIALSGYALFSIFIFNPVQDTLLFVAVIILTSIIFSSTFTLISSIVSRASNSHVLMAVLSFPLVTGTLLIAMRATRSALEGMNRSESVDDLLTLVAINLITGAMAYILFPYIWRS
jgi:heme exporter protein B